MKFFVVNDDPQNKKLIKEKYIIIVRLRFNKLGYVDGWDIRDWKIVGCIHGEYRKKEGLYVECVIERCSKDCEKLLWYHVIEKEQIGSSLEDVFEKFKELYKMQKEGEKV